MCPQTGHFARGGRERHRSHRSITHTKTLTSPSPQSKGKAVHFTVHLLPEDRNFVRGNGLGSQTIHFHSLKGFRRDAAYSPVSVHYDLFAVRVRTHEHRGWWQLPSVPAPRNWAPPAELTRGCHELANDRGRRTSNRRCPVEEGTSGFRAAVSSSNGETGTGSGRGPGLMNTDARGTAGSHGAKPT
jgi:hypothetical protein